MTLRFALNHMVAPRSDLRAFFQLAAALDVSEVEIRNDLEGTAILDGTAPAKVRDEALAHGVAIISINALQRFNEWTAERAEQAEAMVHYAQACGARAIVLCPVNDVSFQPSNRERIEGLRAALDALAPLLRNGGVVGLVEPLGFVECSLRLKREAVEAIDAVGARDVVQLVHDTFHHFVAGEDDMFPERTGLVHVSGVVDPAVPPRSMRDPHRVLVGPDDLIDNVGQVRLLRAAGYAGPISFEPFAQSIANLENPLDAIRASVLHLDQYTRAVAA